MLEDYLLGNKIIRDYSKIFNQKELYRILRWTLVLGIQTLKEELPNYSHLTPKEIEAVIIDNLKAENYPHQIFERYRLRTIYNLILRNFLRSLSYSLNNSILLKYKEIVQKPILSSSLHIQSIKFQNQYFILKFKLWNKIYLHSIICI